MLLFVQKMCDLRAQLSDAVSNMNWFVDQTFTACHVISLCYPKNVKKIKIKNPMKNKINLNKLCENPIKLLTDVMVKK